MTRSLRPALLRLSALLLGVALIAGCGGPGETPESAPGGAPGTLAVVTTFSLLGDLVESIGGEHVHVHSMVPLGTDPHEYQPLPADIEAATNADLIVWNGLGMETGAGWFTNLVEVAGKDLDSASVVEAAAGVTPQWLTEGGRQEVNPHAFLSPRAGMVYVENIAAALTGADPANADDYADGAAELLAEIADRDARYAEELAAVPVPVLVTSERAFQYVAHDYGLTEGYLWQIDTDEQGTPEQMTSLIEFIRAHDVPGLLVETNVDPRPMETVSVETGVPIVGQVYSDELGAPGTAGETYVGYLDSNLRAFLAAMGG